MAGTTDPDMLPAIEQAVLEQFALIHGYMDAIQDAQSVLEDLEFVIARDVTLTDEQRAYLIRRCNPFARKE